MPVLVLCVQNTVQKGTEVPMLRELTAIGGRKRTDKRNILCLRLVSHMGTKCVCSPRKEVLTKHPLDERDWPSLTH